MEMIKITLIILFSLFGLQANSQIIISNVQDFNFGTFYQGNTGGSVDISINGSRSSTGDIILMNTGLAPRQSVFEIEAPTGTVISILEGQDTILTGSNGGTVKLQLQATDLISPFTSTIPPPNRTRLNISAKLIISNRSASPPGVYTGTFNITLHQE